MSRYTGPVNRKSRRYKYSLLETNKEFIKGKKRTTLPGQHGAKKQKLSGYGEHLYEKQKVMYMYGLNERQMKNLFARAIEMKGINGHNFLFLLESRLDNIAYRMGIGSTRRQARQFVTHGHLLVNGKKVDIPSYQVKVGDEISIAEASRSNTFIKDNLTKTEGKTKLFVKFDSNTFSGTYVRLPERDEIAGEIKEGLIIEFYNK